MLYRLLDFYYDYYRGNYVANAKNKNKVTEPYFRVYFSFLLYLPPSHPSSICFFFSFATIFARLLLPRGAQKISESVLCEIF